VLNTMWTWLLTYELGIVSSLRDSSTYTTTRHSRAGLQVVPSLRDSRVANRTRVKFDDMISISGVLMFGRGPGFRDQGFRDQGFRDQTGLALSYELHGVVSSGLTYSGYRSFRPFETFGLPTRLG
jgi:hypothetical protein